MKLEFGQNSRRGTTASPDYGTITKDDGEIIDLNQQAYLNHGGTPTAVWYEAQATSRTRKYADGEAVGYKVLWGLKEGGEAVNDESEACDWDDFELVEI